jgi:tetratricopeptide (TPR) repeat protein
MKKAALVVIAALWIGFSLSALDVTSEPVNPDSLRQGPKYGEDSATCVVNISLYREFFKQWRNSGYKANRAADDAIRPWRWVFLHCPMGTQNTYIDGPKLVEYLIRKEEDEAKKESLIDTLFMIYDQRILYFDKEGFVLGRKGVDMYTYRPAAYQDIYQTLKRSVELEGNRSASAVLVYYFRSALEMLSNEQIEMTEVLEAYETIEAICEHNIQAGGKGAENYSNAWANIELTAESVFSCEDLIQSLGKKFTLSPKDPVLLRKITGILDKKACTDSELFFNASVNLYDVEPSPESAFMIGKMYFRRTDYASAARYLQQATSMEDSNSVADAYLLMATSFLSLKDFSKGRSAAQNASRYRPTDGRPYLLIGDMYAASASDCGDNKLTKKVAFWAAVDKYLRARAIDPSVESEATQKINTYSAYFPVMEDIFFYGLQEGESYTVGCWINEITTVRALQ